MAAGLIELTIHSPDIADLAKRYGGVTSANIRKGAARAINHTLGPARTAIVRAISAKMDAPQKPIRAQIILIKATPDTLVGRIRSQNKPIKLADLGGARQMKSGVSVRKWGMHKGSFAGMASGHRGIFLRVTRARLPIKELYAFSLPKQMAEHYVETTVTRVADERLIPRMDHEIMRLIG